jgi:myo-inositol-1(or 4)-monophosphatase
VTAPVELAPLEVLIRAAARDELVARFRRTSRHEKADGSWITEADLAMQDRLKSALAARHPGIGFLGEEMEVGEQQRLLDDSSGSGIWVLDPLDGTSNFAAGIPLFGVSLALLQGGRVVAGIVYDPMHDESFAATLGGGATLNGEPLHARPAGISMAKTTACIDFKRLPPQLAARIAATPPFSSQRSIGSVALDWCWVAAGRFHLYLHGRQRLWDYAAGSLVLAEAGGFSDTLDGTAAPPTLAPRSAVCSADRGLFEEWCRYLRGT